MHQLFFSQDLLRQRDLQAADDGSVSGHLRILHFRLIRKLYLNTLNQLL